MPVDYLNLGLLLRTLDAVPLGTRSADNYYVEWEFVSAITKVIDEGWVVKNQPTLCKGSR